MACVVLPRGIKCAFVLPLLLLCAASDLELRLTLVLCVWRLFHSCSESSTASTLVA